jgi:potassium-transporting ATPase KdpC subunit
VLAQIRPAAVSLAIFTIITGLLYPLLVTGISQAAMPHQANGSLLVVEGRVVGSELIGQPVGDPKYFWSRLSATSPYSYNGGASSGSNYGPLNPEMLERVKQRVDEIRAAEPGDSRPIPVDLVTASASGLDPHISIEAALYQVPRVAKARGIEEGEVRALVDRSTEGAQWRILGEPRVNVLQLNLALDELK